MKISMAEPDLTGNESKYLQECIETGWISSAGPFIERFEKAFSEFLGVKYASTNSNGTTALHLALLACGVEEGDEVIVPNLTFISTSSTVKHANAKPVLVDVDRKTWNIDPDKIKEAITEKTKAIIPVHLYGNPCDMDSIMKIAEEHNLYVIEDAAESLGAKYNGKQTGSIGHIGCFSFYGNKIMSTGEGGMCVTNDPELFEKINLYKNHGMTKEKRYWHQVVGYNFRMTNIQAAVGLAQLERIDEFISRREKIETKYRELLSGKVEFQGQYDKADQVNWIFSVLIENRDEIMEKLKENNIDCRPLFYPINKMKPYADEKDFPNTKEISEKGLSLPTHIHLTEEQIERVCSFF